MTTLLTKEEASAIYDAMVVLNNIGARIHVSIPFGTHRIIVREFPDGYVMVWEVRGEDDFDLIGYNERYISQAAFADENKLWE